jgi:glutathione-regulated potassium-efflux system ancillary protein KefG
MSTPVHLSQDIGVPQLDSDDLIDAQTVAEIVGLKLRNAVSEYQRRYPDMPRPVVNLGRGRPMLWSRVAIEKWARETGRIK